MGIFLRWPFHANDAREPLASWSVAFFVMLVSGFVTYELFSEWKAAQAMYLWVPTAVTEELGMAAYAGWIKGAWMLFVVPLGVWLALGGLVLLFRGACSMGEAQRRLALPLAVVIAVGHMCKGLVKIVTVSMIAVLLMIVGTGYALRELRLAQGDTHRRYGASVLVLASAFLFLVFGWGFLPQFKEGSLW